MEMTLELLIRARKLRRDQGRGLNPDQARFVFSSPLLKTIAQSAIYPWFVTNRDYSIFLERYHPIVPTAFNSSSSH
jgi:hypothetical protein